MDTRTAINQNLVYLEERITDLQNILSHLLQNNIISQNERDEIKSEWTTQAKNSKLLSILQRKDLPINKFLDILMGTSNQHCAKKVQSFVYLAENITNLTAILMHLRQDGVISENESEEIKLMDTMMLKNVKLLNLIQRKNLSLERFMEILRKTNNGHCADVIEENEEEQKLHLLQPKVSGNELIARNKKMTKKDLESAQGISKLNLENVDFEDEEGNIMKNVDMNPHIFSQSLKELCLDSSSGSKYSISWSCLPKFIESLSLRSMTVKIVKGKGNLEIQGMIPNVNSVELSNLEFIDENDKTIENISINTLLEPCDKIEILKAVGFNMVFDLNKLGSITNLELQGTKIFPFTGDYPELELQSLTLLNVTFVKGNMEIIKNVQFSDIFKTIINKIEITATGMGTSIVTIDLPTVAKQCQYLIIKNTKISLSGNAADYSPEEFILSALKLDHPQFTSLDITQLSNFLYCCKKLDYLSYWSDTKEMKLDINYIPESLKVLELKGNAYPFKATASIPLVFTLDKIILEETPLKICQMSELNCILQRSNTVVIKQLKNFKEMKNQKNLKSLFEVLGSLGSLQEIYIGKFHWDEDFEDSNFLSAFGIDEESDFYHISRKEQNWESTAFPARDFYTISNHEIKISSAPEKRKLNDPKIMTRECNLEDGLEHNDKAESSNCQLRAEETTAAQSGELTNEPKPSTSKGFNFKWFSTLRQKNSKAVSEGNQLAPRNSTSTVSLEEIIRENLSYLSDKLCSIERVSACLYEKKIFTADEMFTIDTKMKSEPPFSRSKELFTILQRKDEDDILRTLITIFEKTENFNISTIFKKYVNPE